jgi:hypothetical protein
MYEKVPKKTIFIISKLSIPIKLNKLKKEYNFSVIRSDDSIVIFFLKN